MTLMQRDRENIELGREEGFKMALDIIRLHEESLWPTDLPPDLLHGFRHAAMPAAKVRRFCITVFDYNRFSFTGKRSHKTESQKHPVLKGGIEPPTIWLSAIRSTR